jgi:hypothetical protein
MPQNRAEPIVAPEHTDPDWYHAYFVAMMERDRTKALLQIQRARIAIQERTRELRHSDPSSPREIHDLINALTYLGILLAHIGTESGNLLWD